MKKLAVLVLLVAVAFAVNTKVQTVLPPVEDNRTNVGTPPNGTTPAPDYMPLIGRIEPIMYTSYDWQCNGPMHRAMILDPVANGFHCYWMWSNFVPATDRNQRYNFYDFSTRTWNWLDGVNVYTERSGFGSMDRDPSTGCAIATTHRGGTGAINMFTARDQAPGAGLFEYGTQLTGFQWPMAAVTNNQAIHVAVLNTVDQDSLWYARMQPWNTWTTPIRFPTDPSHTPLFPDHNIASSKTSNKVCIMWEMSEDVGQERAFYRTSTDGGNTWSAADIQLPFPPTTNLTPSYNISSLFAMYDNSDNLHFVISVADTGRTIPAEIWHYCPTNPTPWKLVHYYTAETLNAAVGYNAIFATRPTIVQASTGNFYVTWEQFDSLNFEPVTSLARADIYCAELTNNGQTVTRKGRITDPNTTSKRFPCVGGVKDDTVFVIYEIDSIAGFENYTQGPATRNPVICQRFHRLSLPPGVEENPSGPIYNFTLNSAYPNPSNSNMKISYSVSTANNVELTIYDVVGRPIRTLVNGTKTAGEYSAIWNGRTNTGEKVQAGIYFYTLTTPDRSISRKLIRTY
jgi:hypothetical protein